MEKTHRTKPTYFKSKNNRWMKQYIDENGKSKTIFVKKEEIKNIPKSVIDSEKSKSNIKLTKRVNDFEVENSKLKVHKEKNSTFIKQYRECF